MTTADRIDPVGYRAWAAPVVIADGGHYVAKHCHAQRRVFSLHRMFYTARHARRR